jgi:hypothetical protein
VARARGRNVRRIVVRRTSRKAYTLRLTLTTSGHGHKKRRIVVKRRVRGC